MVEPQLSHKVVLKCAGAWTGQVSLDLHATVAELRALVASASGAGCYSNLCASLKLSLSV